MRVVSPLSVNCKIKEKSVPNSRLPECFTETMEYVSKLPLTATADPHFSVFRSLNSDVKLAILEKLESREFLRIARISREWYATALNAPQLFKPDILLFCLYLDRHGFLQGYSRFRSFHYSPETTKFGLANRIEVKDFYVNPAYSLCDPLISIKDRVTHVESLEVSCSEKKLEMDHIVFLVRICDNFKFIAKYPHFMVLSDKMEEALEKNLQIEDLSLDCYISTNMAKKMIKQLVNEERPKFRYFACNLCNNTKEPWKEVLEDCGEYLDEGLSSQTNVLTVDPDLLSYAVIFQPSEQKDEDCMFRLTIRPINGFSKIFH